MKEVEIIIRNNNCLWLLGQMSYKHTNQMVTLVKCKSLVWPQGSKLEKEII